jgi:hypothetical protein
MPPEDATAPGPSNPGTATSNQHADQSEHVNGTRLALVSATDEDHFGDLDELFPDDAIPVDPKYAGRDVTHVWFHIPVTDEIREWVAKLMSAHADGQMCEGMAWVVDKWGNGGREEQLRGTYLAIGRAHGGHRGLATAIDELWGIRAKEPRGFRRMLEGARAKVLKDPRGWPQADSCSCDRAVSLAVGERVDRSGGEDTAEGAADVSDGAEDVEEDIPSSWVPKDLHAVWDNAGARKVPEVLHRVDGRAMFYPGHTHSVHGESESGKSWVAQVAAVEVLHGGGRVLYLDYESDELDVVGRLRALGMSRDWLDRFDYVSPDGPRDAAFAELLARPYRLAVVDGVTAALAAEPDAKSNDGDAVTTWDKALPRRIARKTGAAVVMVDHVTKSNDGRGRFAIGSQAKMSNVSGSAFYVDVEAVLRPRQIGVLRLFVGKDRPGGVREHAGPMRKDRLQPFARFVFDALDPDVIEVELVPWLGGDDEAQREDDEQARAALDEKVLAAVRDITAEGKTASQAKLREVVGGRASDVDATARRLESAGRLVDRGKGTAHAFVIPTPSQ